MESKISEKLLQQIRNCTNMVHRLIHSEHRDISPGPRGISIGRGQGLVLNVLMEKNGLSQTEVAEKLDIRPSSLGELVMKLEENGFVERRHHENNKRTIYVYLTEKGREIGKENINSRQKAAEAWCAGLTETEKEQLNELLEKLIVSMETALPKNEIEFHNQGISFDHRRPQGNEDGFPNRSPRSFGDYHGRPHGDDRDDVPSDF